VRLSQPDGAVNEIAMPIEEIQKLQEQVRKINNTLGVKMEKRSFCC